MSPAFIEIARSDIDSGRTDDVVEVLDSLGDDPQAALELVGEVVLVVSGYDNDARELWEVPEARSWFRELAAELPHLLLFLSPDARMPSFYLAMLLPQLDPTSIRDFVVESFVAINAFCEAAGLDPDHPAIAHQTDRMVKSIYE